MELHDFIKLNANEKKQFFLDNININVKFANKPYIYKDTGEDINEIDAMQITHELVEERSLFGVMKRMQIILPDGIVAIPNYKIHNLMNTIEDINIFATGTVVLYYHHWQMQEIQSDLISQHSLRYYIL